MLGKDVEMSCVDTLKLIYPLFAFDVNFRALIWSGTGSIKKV